MASLYFMGLKCPATGSAKRTFARPSSLRGVRDVRRALPAWTPAPVPLPTFFLHPAIRSLRLEELRSFSDQGASGRTRLSCGFPDAKNVCRKSEWPCPAGAEDWL